MHLVALMGCRQNKGELALLLDYKPNLGTNSSYASCYYISYIYFSPGRNWDVTETEIFKNLSPRQFREGVSKNSEDKTCTWLSSL